MQSLVLVAMTLSRLSKLLTSKKKNEISLYGKVTISWGLAKASIEGKVGAEKKSCPSNVVIDVMHLL